MVVYEVLICIYNEMISKSWFIATSVDQSDGNEKTVKSMFMILMNSTIQIHFFIK